MFENGLPENIMTSRRKKTDMFVIKVPQNV